MNNLRIMFCGFIVGVIACVGTANASYVQDNFKKTSSHHLPFFTFGTAFVTSQMGLKRDMVNAVIDSSGAAIDYYNKNQIYKKRARRQVSYMAPTFIFDVAVNYGVRKTSTYLNSNGISIEVLANKCDVLPEGYVRNIVNPVVKAGAIFATEPQIVTAFIVWLGKSLLGLKEGVEK